MVVAQAELAGDDLGAESRRRLEAGGVRLLLDVTREVGQAELLVDELVEEGDGDRAVGDGDVALAELVERGLELAGVRVRSPWNPPSDFGSTPARTTVRCSDLSQLPRSRRGPAGRRRQASAIVSMPCA